jgi:hypothetical protein
LEEVSMKAIDKAIAIGTAYLYGLECGKKATLTVEEAREAIPELKEWLRKELSMEAFPVGPFVFVTRPDREYLYLLVLRPAEAAFSAISRALLAGMDAGQVKAKEWVQFVEELDPVLEKLREFLGVDHYDPDWPNIRKP